MSCVVCKKSIGSSYVVSNNMKIHRECESQLGFCDTCYNNSVVDGKCLSCVSTSYHRCDVCGKNIKSGQISSGGRLMCSKCISDEYERKHNYVDSCYRKCICYKCGSPIKTEKETRYYGITAAEYEVEQTVCPKCGVLR